MSKPNLPFDLVLDSLDDQIALVDANGTILHVNRAWIEFGVKNGMPNGIEWAGENYLAALDAAEASDAEKGIREVLEGRLPSFSREYPCHSPTEKRWFMMRIAAVVPGSLFVVSHYNITQRKLREEKVALLSLQDPLTGLFNRRAFDERLEQAFRRIRRQKEGPVSLLLVDLDNFKSVNDEFGHQTGDRLLVETARVLTGAIREKVDYAFRIGGDEFAVLLFSDHRIACEKAEHILEGMDGKVSIGVATFSEKDREAEDVGTFFRLADEALYEAKRLGRGRFQSSESMKVA